METLINSDSTVTQLWNPITVRNPEYGGNMFFEVSVRTRGTQYEVPEGICNHRNCSQTRGQKFMTECFMVAVM
jgi:hypothetical protein